MGISAWVVYYDLSKWNPGRSRLGSVQENTLEYFSFYRQGEAGERCCLYVIDASELPNAYRQNPDTAFLCLGEPDASFSDMDARIIWIHEKIPIRTLISELTACFHRYQKWYSAMMEGIRSRKPLHLYASLSLPLFRQPVSVYSSNFKLLCFSYDEARYGSLPKDYSVFNPGTYIPEDIMQNIEGGGRLDRSLAEKEPYLYVSYDGFRCLCVNIWVLNRNVAILEVDEINRPLNERDRALIYMLSQAIQLALESGNLVNFSVQSEFNNEILGLLEGRTIPHSVLREGLKELNWNLEDRYSCLVFQSIQRHTVENALWANGETLVHILPFSIYVIFQNSIVLICRRSGCAAAQYKKALRRVRDKLVNINMVGGISTEFIGFEKLSYFAKAAKQAIELGLTERPGQYLYDFQAFLLELVRKSALNGISPEVFIPPELLDVIVYDRKQNGDYCKVLYSLLKNNMSPSAAAAELYMHRNTVINRLGMLRSKFNMNLDSYGYRLQLMLAFLFLNQDQSDTEELTRGGKSARMGKMR